MWMKQKTKKCAKVRRMQKINASKDAKKGTTAKKKCVRNQAFKVFSTGPEQHQEN